MKGAGRPESERWETENSNTATEKKSKKGNNALRPLGGMLREALT